MITHKGGDTFKTIIETLTIDLNYKIIGVEVEDGVPKYNPRKFLANSRNFGIPQNRPRVYILGFSREEYPEADQILENLELPTKSESEPIYRDLHDLLDYNAEPKFYLSQQYLDTLKAHRNRHKSKGNGYGYIVVNESSIRNPISNAILATGGSGKERNLVFDPQIRYWEGSKR